MVQHSMQTSRRTCSPPTPARVKGTLVSVTHATEKRVLLGYILMLFPPSLLPALVVRPEVEEEERETMLNKSESI